MGEISTVKSGSTGSRECSLSWEEKMAWCERWKASGLGKRYFCKKHKLVLSTFYGWCEHLWPREKGSGLCEVKLVQADMSKEEIKSTFIDVELNFASQILMRVSVQEGQLHQLIKGLAYATTTVR